MKVLVLWATDDNPNLGVQALASGTAELVRSAFPEADIRFRGTGPTGDGPLSISHTTPLLHDRFTRNNRSLDWLQSFDLVIDTGAGDSFTDIYGFKRLVKKSVINELARQAGVPLVLSPQTIGPFTTLRSRTVARWVMKAAVSVMARDNRSADYARKLGRTVDVISTDVVFGITRPKIPKTRDLVLNVSGLLWEPNPHLNNRDYQDTVIGLVREAESLGRTVTLLSHVLPNDGKWTYDNDVNAISQLQDRIGHEREHVVPSSLTQVREVVGSANVVLGARMHACLNALSMGTPAIPMAYSRKFEPLMADLGWPHVVDLRREEAKSEVKEYLRRDLQIQDVQPILDAASERLAHARGALTAIAP